MFSLVCQPFLVRTVLGIDSNGLTESTRLSLLSYYVHNVSFHINCSPMETSSEWIEIEAPTTRQPEASKFINFDIDEVCNDHP